MPRRAHQLSLPLGKCDRTNCPNPATVSRAFPCRLGGAMVNAELHLCPLCEGILTTHPEGWLPQIAMVS